MTYTESRQYQEALEQFCATQCPQYFVTLHFHATHSLTIFHAQKSLRHFAAQLDHKLLGNRWASFEPEMRTGYIAIPEGHFDHHSSQTNPAFYGLHYHLALTPASGKKASLKEDYIRDLAGRLWTKCAPSGDVDVQAVGGGAVGIQAVSSYICKRVSSPEAIGLDYFVVG